MTEVGGAKVGGLVVVAAEVGAEDGAEDEALVGAEDGAEVGVEVGVEVGRAVCPFGKVVKKVFTLHPIAANPL